MLRSEIHPTLFQSVLDSAPNAARKGQAQYFTPPKWAALLALPLPEHRPVLYDLACGNGRLLNGAANTSTEHRIGCDIDASALRAGHYNVAADLTLFAPLLHDVRFQADLFVLNPPWDLHWRRERLAFLNQSAMASVRHAFAAHDGRTTRDTIDSSVATLCLALDRCSDMGEGFVLMNTATANRLVLDDDAPHAALRDHVWAVVELPEKTAAPVASSALYFAKDHTRGVQFDERARTPEEAEAVLKRLAARRDRREGAEVRSWLCTEGTETLWQAAADEYRHLHAANHTAPKFNLWLDHAGHIGAHVSLYDAHTGRVPKDEAALLHSIAGKRPMQLVIQRAQRDALLRACGLQKPLLSRPADTLSSVPNGGEGRGEEARSPWKVDPELQRAVLDAIRDYHAARAPLYPLPAIQRLGYLDEEDWIQCRSDLSPSPGGEGRGEGGPVFLAGRRYAITTQTIAVRRPGRRVNVEGVAEELELTGQELAIFITGEDGRRHCFMEARLLRDGVKIERPLDNHEPGTRNTEQPAGPEKKQNIPDDRFAPAAEVIDFTLQQLVETFIVPEVPDVAAVNPEGYQRNLQRLEEIESLCR